MHYGRIASLLSCTKSVARMPVKTSYSMFVVPMCHPISCFTHSTDTQNLLQTPPVHLQVMEHVCLTSSCVFAKGSTRGNQHWAPLPVVQYISVMYSRVPGVGNARTQICKSFCKRNHWPWGEILGNPHPESLNFRLSCPWRKHNTISNRHAPSPAAPHRGEAHTFTIPTCIQMLRSFFGWNHYICDGHCLGCHLLKCHQMASTQMAPRRGRSSAYPPQEVAQPP